MPDAPRATSRGRGRPPGSTGSSGTTEAILDAALEQFSQQGYARTTIRGIAALAGVDPALVSRAFGGKRELFVATVVARSQSAESVLAALEGDSATAGVRLVETYLRLWEDPCTRRGVMALARATLGESEPLAAELFPMLESATHPDLRVRRERLHAVYDTEGLQLAMAQLFGVGVARHALEVPGVAQMDLTALVQLLAPSVQQLIVRTPATPA